MSETETDDTEHVLPELLDRVLNGETDGARCDGWQVKIDPEDGQLVIETYEKNPELGGRTDVRARFNHRQDAAHEVVEDLGVDSNGLFIVKCNCGRQYPTVFDQCPAVLEQGNA